MIPRDYITEWRTHAPWVQDFQVEQDLVISRALVLRDPQFIGDLGPLLAAGFEWETADAAALVSTTLIERLPGKPWQGETRG